MATHILIGNCCYKLSKLKEAKDHYKNALKISRKISDKDERLKGKSSALGNIGLIYKDLGKPDEALKYLKKSLDIFKRFGAMSQVKITLKNIEIIQKMKNTKSN